MSNHTSLRSADEIQALLERSSLSSPLPTTLSPGESLYNLGGGTFSPDSVKLSVSSSGSGKLLPVKLVTPTCLNDLCLGFVGMHKRAFCLKSKSVCETISHSTSKFESEPNVYYVCKTVDATAVWCNLSIPKLSVKLSYAGEEFDMTKTRSIEAWRATISMLGKVKSESSQFEIEAAVEALTETDVAKLMKTPGKIRPTSKSLLNPEGLNEDTAVKDFLTIKSEFKCLSPNIIELLSSLDTNDVKAILKAFHQDLSSLAQYTSQNFEQ